MSDNTEPKKVSLQDAIRQKLAQKKEQANTGNQSSAYFEGGPKAMKSQNNKSLTTNAAVQAGHRP